MSIPLDLTKKYPALFAPSPKVPAIVEVPPFSFLMLDGQGDPNTSPAYQSALEALFQLSYGLKFTIKKAGGQEYRAMPLEGLWWTPDMDLFSVSQKDAWYWTMMILQPEPVTAEWVERVRAQLLAKKIHSPLLEQVRFEEYAEGLSVQLMHIGPYAAEGPNIAAMHAFARQAGYRLVGKHHEIYLGDPRRSAPEKLKTILRQPITR
jgi:hypothetical protein